MRVSAGFFIPKETTGGETRQQEKNKMNMAGRVLLSAAVIGATLAACGGGDAVSTPSDRTAGQGIAVGEPNGGVPVVSEYIKMAQEASCAGTRNKLFVIDSQYVLWDRAGQCADASYAQTLMGPTPQAVLCSAGQTIAGPRTTCSDASLRPLFDTMLQHLDQPDLGLGAAHKVEAIDLLPAPGLPLAFQTLSQTTRSGVDAPREVVVRDADAWAALWQEHAGASLPLPAVDFSRQMVIGVFLGARPNGCYATAVSSIVPNEGRLEVLHLDSEPGPGVVCTMAVTTPAHLVVVDRSSVPVVFAKKIHFIG